MTVWRPSKNNPHRMWVAAMILSAGLAAPTLAQEDTWVEKSPMPAAREKSSACVIDGIIYVIGGADGSGGVGRTTNEAYNPGTNNWSARAPMPTARRRASANVVDGKCYVIGGHMNNIANGLTQVEAYDPRSDSWTSLAPMTVPNW